MKHQTVRRFLAALVCAVLLLGLAACGGGGAGVSPTPAPDTSPSPENTLPTEQDPKPDSTPDESQNTPDDEIDGEAAQAALALLRSCMEMSPKFAMAVAYLGYREQGDPTPLAEWLRENDSDLMEEMPFILNIAKDEKRILGSGCGDLFCFVPRDDTTTLAVNHVVWKSDSAGARPEADQVLYRNEFAQPVLVFVGFEEFRDKPDIMVSAVAGNGASMEWCPYVSGEEDGFPYLKLPTDQDYDPLLMDFTSFTDPMDPGGWELPGDCWWLPPTDEGLADSEWSCGEGWRMEFLRGNGGPGYAGLVQILFQSREGQEYQLLYSGVWRMEDDCLYLKTDSPSGEDAFEGRFPLLISPSGDDLYIQQDRDTLVCPPFFDDDMSAMGLLRIYG